MVLDKELLDDIESLDDNAKIILRHSLLICLGAMKEQEKRIIGVIDKLQMKGLK